MKLAVLLLSALLFGCGGGGGSSEPEKCTVELNGDSILDAPGIKRPGLVLQERQPSWVIDDRSIQGLSLYALMRGHSPRWVVRLAAEKEGIPYAKQIHTSRIVVIENGGIEALEIRDLKVYEEDLREIVSQVRMRGATPIFTGIVQIEEGPIFTAPTIAHRKLVNDVMKKVASDMNVPFVGWDTISDYKTIDGIHRDQASSDMLVDKLEKVISAQCK